MRDGKEVESIEGQGGHLKQGRGRGRKSKRQGTIAFKGRHVCGSAPGPGTGTGPTVLRCREAMTPPSSESQGTGARAGLRSLMEVVGTFFNIEVSIQFQVFRTLHPKAR